MQRSLALAVFLVGPLLNGSAAAKPPSAAAIARHQLVACMTKRMSVDRSVFYYDAERWCKAERATEPAPLVAAVRDRPGSGSR